MDSIQHKRKVSLVLLAFLPVLFHFVFLIVHFEPAISTPDANGYFAQAKMIAKEGKTYLEPESILQYIGPHWLHRSDNHYFTTFPPGFPAVLAVIYRVFGPKVTLLVSPLMASLTLLGLFLLCRLWIGKSWALLAVALIAVNPFANEHALFGDSHIAVVFFLIWALFFLVKWSKTDSIWWAFGAGLSLGIIPTIRYPEALLTLAFGIFVLIHLKEKKISWRSLMVGAIGAAIPLGMLCIRNQMAFGAFWKTGYALSNDPANLGWNYFISYSLSYLQMLINEGCGLMFILGIIGIVVLCARRSTWKQGILFLLLVVPLTILYMSYCWKPDSQSMRFLLPTFYIYTIAGVYLLRIITNKRYSLAWAGSAVLLLITILWGFPPSLHSLQYLKKRNAILAQVTDEIEKHVEPGSILITNEGISQHLDFIGCWRLIDASIMRISRFKPQRVFAPGKVIPKRKVLRNVEALTKYEDLTGKELFNSFSNDVWQWAGNGRKVYLVVNEEQISEFKSRLSQYDKLETIEKIEIPELRLDNFELSSSIRPPKGRMKELTVPQGPMGPNQIFDFRLNGEPLYLVEWTRTFP
ncbi:glycosyltransferase family 39 protein [candidate division WOR-3 bacterium]|nr:glycosyltransferase family 39 protein [candidate division WOR-3 bacterium]